MSKCYAKKKVEKDHFPRQLTTEKAANVSSQKTGKIVEASKKLNKI